MALWIKRMLLTLSTKNLLSVKSFFWQIPCLLPGRLDSNIPHTGDTESLEDSSMVAKMKEEEEKIIICHVSHVTCQVSCVTCRMLCVTCH